MSVMTSRLAAMVALIAERLRQRVRSSGSTPLLTYYDLDSGERTELSATSFSNWVDKTSNLLIDEVAVDPGNAISMALAVEAPGHWLTAVWELACWQIGAVVDITNPAHPAAVVAGRRWQGYAAQEVYACALHPLGFGFGEPLPDGVRDYAIEVRNQPDRFSGPSADPAATAWVDPDQTFSQADLIKIHGPPARRLVRVSAPWATCRDGVVTALVTGGSAVVATRGDADQLTRIAKSERIAT
jgi:uncharacterized protein (TIGR03089 family)